MKMSRFTHTALSILAITCVVASAARAGALFTVDTSDGTGADTYVNAGASAGSNFGNSGFLNIKDPGAVNDFTRKGYVRFDLSDLRLGGASVTGAWVDYVVALNNGGSVAPSTPQNFTVFMYGLNDGHAGEGWAEGSINWTNAPANDTASDDGVTGDAASIGNMAVTSSDVVGDTVTFSSTGLMNFLNADTDGRVTMILGRNSSNSSHNLNFATKENGTYAAPQLSFTTDSRFYDARADAYVNDDDSTNTTIDQQNFGTATNLVVKDSGDSRFTRKVYVGFDISGAPLVDLRDAELMLDVASHDQGGASTLSDMTVELWGLNDGHAGESWIEGTGQTGVTGATPPNPIVFDNAPANATEGNGITSDATLLASIVIDASVLVGDTVSFTNADSVSSDALLNFLQADSDGLVTFIIRRVGGDTQNNLAFASKEHATYAGPTLRLEIPAPSALPAGLALMTLAAARRRRQR